MKEFKKPQGVAVVTGAASGMGAACCEALAEDGWSRMLLCDLDAALLGPVAASHAARGVEVRMLTADIGAPSFDGKLLEALGSDPISALIHAAGVSPPRVETERIFTINLDASLRLIETVRPHMATGSVAVFFASLAGYLPVSVEAQEAFEQSMPETGSAHLWHFASDANEAYLLSKRAVIAAVKREAKAFGKRGSRIVSVSPGLIDTPMTRGVENELTVSLLNSSAIPRYGLAAEVASVCAFLCSPAASFMTGCDVRVDGGQLAGLGI